MDALTRTNIEQIKDPLVRRAVQEIRSASAQGEHHGRMISMMKATIIVQRVEAQGGSIREAIRLLQEEVDRLS